MTRPSGWEVDKRGMTHPRYDTTGMLAPFLHPACGAVFDGGKVKVLERYTDCSRFKCPGCGRMVDDRPAMFGFGGLERLR